MAFVVQVIDLVVTDPVDDGRLLCRTFNLEESSTYYYNIFLCQSLLSTPNCLVQGPQHRDRLGTDRE
jgi:hypothetical protein